MDSPNNFMYSPEQKPDNIYIDQAGRQWTPPIVQEANDLGFLRWSIDQTNMLAQVEMVLSGQYYDEREKKWIQFDTPQCNKEGTAFILSLLKPRANYNGVMSNLKEDEITSIIRYTSYDYVKRVASNWKKWSFMDDQLKPSPSKMTFGLHLVQDVLKITLNRARASKTGKIVQQTYSYDDRSYTAGQHQDKKKTFFDWLRGG